MNADKSGAGYGNHGGDETFKDGQDGEKSKDHEQGKSNERLESGPVEIEPEPDAKPE